MRNPGVDVQHFGLEHHESNDSRLPERTLLAARSGLFTPEQYRENLASAAAQAEDGRNWRRSSDYYEEGDLMWMEAATVIARETKGQKSIDDFCHGGKVSNTFRYSPLTRPFPQRVGQQRLDRQRHRDVYRTVRGPSRDLDGARIGRFRKVTDIDRHLDCFNHRFHSARHRR